MRAADARRTRFRHAPVQDLPFLHEVGDHARHVFHGHLRIHAVLIEKIDVVGAKALQGPFHGATDVIRTAVELLGFLFFDPEAELRRDHDLVAHGLKRFADPGFARVGTVDFGRVEEGHARIIGAANERDHVFLAVLAAVVAHHRQTAETDRGDFERAETTLFSHVRKTCRGRRGRSDRGPPGGPCTAHRGHAEENRAHRKKVAAGEFAI